MKTKTFPFIILTAFDACAGISGNKIACLLNGKVMIETTDDTFAKEGSV